MNRISDIYEALCAMAPLSLQMSFDNSGFQLGSLSSSVDTVLLALDLTDAVIEEAEEMKAGLIITHHPLLFHPLKQISADDPAQARIMKLVRRDISVISMHTNLDIAESGVNDVLIRLLGAEPQEVLDEEGCGRIGCLEKPAEMEEFTARCRDRLNNKYIRYYSSGKAVSRLAVMGGAGGDAMENAFRKGCDTYVTADLKYHEFLRAAELGMNLIDADHFCTEAPVMHTLRERLSACFPDTRFAVSKRHSQITDILV